MEESSEKRRERLRAMREEASAAGEDGDGGGGGGVLSFASPPEASGWSPLSDIQQQPLPPSPSPRFEFYTDPLAAFGASQRKKSRNSFGSPFSGAPPPRKTSPSPFPQPNVGPSSASSTPGVPSLNMTRTPNSNPSPNRNPNPNPNFTSSGGSSLSSRGHNHQASTMLARPHTNTNTTSSYFNPNMNLYRNASPNHSSVPHGNFYPNTTPPGVLNTPASIQQGNSESSGYGPKSSTPYGHNGAVYSNFPATYDYNGVRGSFSAESPQRHVGGAHDNTMQSYSSNRSWGSFRQSPGSSNKGTPARTGGKGFQRSYGNSTGESFAKRSMLEDPWKDLVPVRIESVAFRLESCSPVSSQDWLLKSASKVTTPSSTQGIAISVSGPSLAESLAASLADAVGGDGL